MLSHAKRHGLSVSPHVHGTGHTSGRGQPQEPRGEHTQAHQECGKPGGPPIAEGDTRGQVQERQQEHDNTDGIHEGSFA